MAGNNLEQEEPKSKNTIDIYPIKKGRRMLVSLADFFITLIAAILLFSVASYPLAKLATGANTKNQQRAQYEKDRFDILYDNDILYYDTDEEYYYDGNLDTTALMFVDYYVNDADISNEVIYHYYIDIKKGSVSDMVALYEESDSYYHFMDFENLNPLGLPTLKENYKTEFKAIFDEKDELGAQGEADYDRFTRYVFLAMYGRVMTDILENDLGSPINMGSYSYVELTNMMEDLALQDDNTIQITAIITYFIACIIFYLIVPLTNRRGRTLGLLILGEERVQNNTLRFCHKTEISIQFVYHFVFNLPMLMFVPFPSIDFVYLFNLGMLFILSLIGLLFVIISAIFMFVSSYTQTISDKLSKTIVLDKRELEEIFRQKGYYI